METLKKTQVIIMLTLIIIVMLGLKVADLMISKFHKKPELVMENNANVSLVLI